MKQFFDILNQTIGSLIVILTILGVHPALGQDKDLLSEIQSIETSAETTPMSQTSLSEVECSGHLVPREVFTLQLKPGERVEFMAVKTGDKVNKGDLLVQLANDALLEHRSSLQEKRFAMMQTGDKIRLLDMRIKTLAQAIDQLEKKISEERAELAKLDEYTAEKDLMQWADTLRTKKNELSVLNTERTIAVEQLAQQAEIDTTYAELSEQLDQQRNALTVRAPFSGRVVFTGHNYGRAMAGERILELRDDQKLIVNATVWQHQLPYIHIGSRAKVFPHFFQEVFVWGEVKTIEHSNSVTTDGGFPVFPVIIELDNASEELISGMGVSVKIIADDHPVEEHQ